MTANDPPQNEPQTASGNRPDLAVGSPQPPGPPNIAERQKSDLPPRTTNWIALAVMALLAIGAGLAFQVNRSRRVVPQGPTRQDWIDLHSRATQLRSRGRLNEAQQAAVAAVEIAPAVYPAGHFAIPESLNMLGLILTDSGRYEDAIASFQQAIPMLEAIFGPDTKEVAQVAGNMGLALTKYGMFDEADKVLRAVRAAIVAATGPESDDTLQATTNLAVLFEARGKHAEARPLLEEVLRIRRENTGPASLETARAMTDLATCLRRIEDAEAADGSRREQIKKLYQTASLIQTRLLPADSLTVATTLSGRAKLALLEGDLETAEQLALESLAIRQARLGPTHRTVAIPYLLLAEIGEQTGNVSDAETYFNRALQIRLARLRPDHPQAIETLVEVAGFHERQAATAKLRDILEALAAAQTRGGSRPTEQAATLERLAGVLRTLAAEKEEELKLADATAESKAPNIEAGATADELLQREKIEPGQQETAAEVKSADEPATETVESLLARAADLDKQAEAIRLKEADRISAEAKNAEASSADTPAAGAEKNPADPQAASTEPAPSAVDQTPKPAGGLDQPPAPPSSEPAVTPAEKAAEKS